MKLLSKQSLEEAKIKPHQGSVSDENIAPITSEEDRQNLLAVISAQKIRLEGRKSCKRCKESLAENGFVCGRHYHDFEYCGADDCLSCYLGQSGEEAFPDNYKWDFHG